MSLQSASFQRDQGPSQPCEKNSEGQKRERRREEGTHLDDDAVIGVIPRRDGGAEQSQDPWQSERTHPCLLDLGHGVPDGEERLGRGERSVMCFAAAKKKKGESSRFPFPTVSLGSACLGGGGRTTRSGCGPACPRQQVKRAKGGLVLHLGGGPVRRGRGTGFRGTPFQQHLVSPGSAGGGPSLAAPWMLGGSLGTPPAPRGAAGHPSASWLSSSLENAHLDRHARWNLGWRRHREGGEGGQRVQGPSRAARPQFFLRGWARSSPWPEVPITLARSPRWPAPLARSSAPRWPAPL